MDHDKLLREDRPQVGDVEESTYHRGLGDGSPGRPQVRTLRRGANDRRALQDSYVGPGLPPNFDLAVVVS